MAPGKVTELPTTMSPYREAWLWIRQHPGTTSADGLAKLLLSLWNPRAAYSFRECVDRLDGPRAELALRIAIHFVNFGEDAELSQIGYELAELLPDLWRRGQLNREAR